MESTLVFAIYSDITDMMYQFCLIRRRRWTSQQNPLQKTRRPSLALLNKRIMSQNRHITLLYQAIQHGLIITGRFVQSIRQIDRHTDRQTDRQKDKLTVRHSISKAVCQLINQSNNCP